MKMIRKDSDTENEFLIYLQISHENVLKYFDHFEHEEDGLDYICIITEYCQVHFCTLFLIVLHLSLMSIKYILIN